MFRNLSIFALSFFLFSCASKPAQTQSRQPASQRAKECRPELCPVPAMECMDGKVMVSDPPREGECCPFNYRCEKPAQKDIDCRAVPCPAIAPAKCKEGERLAPGDGQGCCVRPKCVPSALPDCAAVRCMMKMPKCMRGEEAVDMRKKGACCPDMKCVNQQGEDKCLKAACPAVEPPSCEDDLVLRDNRKAGACCPSWSCEEDGDPNEEL
jgi:hypothetical protein